MYCRYAGRVSSNSYLWTGWQSGVDAPAMLLSDVECVGNERSIADCDHNGWGFADCHFIEAVSIKCDLYAQYGNFIYLQ